MKYIQISLFWSPHLALLCTYTHTHTHFLKEHCWEVTHTAFMYKHAAQPMCKVHLSIIISYSSTPPSTINDLPLPEHLFTSLCLAHDSRRWSYQMLILLLFTWKVPTYFSKPTSLIPPLWFFPQSPLHSSASIFGTTELNKRHLGTERQNVIVSQGAHNLMKWQTETVII